MMRRPSWRSRLSPGLAAAGLALGIGFLGGCIGFNPATPEPPLHNDCAPDFVGDYQSPTGILQTISRAMRLKARGRCGYIAAFADSVSDGYSYHATFPPELEVERQRLGLPVPVWTRALELTYYDDFMQLTESGMELTWSPYDEAGSDQGGAGGNDSTLFRRYAVTPRGSAELLAAGVADLSFQRLPSGRWVLTEWKDRVDPSRSTDPSVLQDLTVSQRRLEAYDANF